MSNSIISCEIKPFSKKTALGLLACLLIGCGQTPFDIGEQNSENFTTRPPGTKEANKNSSLQKNMFQEVSLADISFDNAPGRCTGPIIGPDLVLTAGHCFDDYAGKAVKAVSLSVRLKNGGSFAIDRADIQTSGAFFVGETFYKDIGFVKLKKVIPNALPLTVGTNSQNLKPLENYVFFGFSSGVWRDMTLENWQPANFMGIAPAVWNRWTLRATIASNSLAQGGDSGGPLLINQNGKWLLLGVLQGDTFRDPASRKRLTFTAVDQALAAINAVAGGGGIKTEAIR